MLKKNLNSLTTLKVLLFAKKLGPCGVIKSSADGKIENTGALTKKRMEIVDDKTAVATIDFMKCLHKVRKPFFTWWSRYVFPYSC